MSKINVVLIEDHDLTRMGLRTALQKQSPVQVVGEAANGIDGLKVLQAEKPDIAVVDIGLPDIDGIEVTRRLKAMSHSVNPEDLPKVLILTMQDNEDTVLAAFAAGADSYCMKDIGIDKLVDALQQTYEGNSWIDPAIARIVLQQARYQLLTDPTQPVVEPAQPSVSDLPPTDLNSESELESERPSEASQAPEIHSLTDRELEVLELIVAGCSNAAIAEKLYITVGTVKTHVRNILNKLCAHDRTQAAVRALRSGLVHWSQETNS